MSTNINRTIWVAGWNMAGYLPESEPFMSSSWEAARDYLVDALDSVFEFDEAWELREQFHALPAGSEHGGSIGHVNYTLTIDTDMTRNVDKMFRGYVDAALWSTPAHVTIGDNGEIEPDANDDRSFEQHNFDIDDLDDETALAMWSDCADFYVDNWELLEDWPMSETAIGHDFWLTREGHGTGFWDRGLGDAGEALTEASKGYGDFFLWVTNDGKVSGS